MNTPPKKQPPLPTSTKTLQGKLVFYKPAEQTIPAPNKPGETVKALTTGYQNENSPEVLAIKKELLEFHKNFNKNVDLIIQLIIAMQTGNFPQHLKQYLINKGKYLNKEVINDLKNYYEEAFYKPKVNKDTGEVIGRELVNSMYFVTIFEQITNNKPTKSKRAGPWRDIATRLKGKFIERKDLFSTLPSKEIRTIFSTAWQVYTSHKQKHKIWFEDMYKWQYSVITGNEAKIGSPEIPDFSTLIKFVKKNTEPKNIKNSLIRHFISRKPLLGKTYASLSEELMKEEGALRLNFERWHKYREWLVDTSDSILKEPIPKETKELIISQTGKQFRTALEAYPDLKELNKNIYDLIGTFRFGKKTHETGFTLPPTYTRVNYINHPQWYVFGKDETYRNLDFKKGKIDILLNKNWVTVDFLADSRFKSIEPLETPIEVSGDKYYYRYTDKTNPEHPRFALVSGAKLKIEFPPGVEHGNIDIVRGDNKTELYLLQNSEFYLYFTTTFESKNFIKGKQNVPNEILDNVKEIQKAEKINILPRGIAIDLRQFNNGALTLCEYDNTDPKEIKINPIPIKYKTINPSRKYEKTILTNQGGWIIDIESAYSLEEILQLGKQLSEKEKISRSSLGHKTLSGLRNKINNLREDRYKKIVSKIIETALLNQAKILIIENLLTYQPSLEFGKKENTRLMSWSHRAIVNRLQETAPFYGLRLILINPAYTSRLCSRCGIQENLNIPGHAFSELNKKQIKKYHETPALRQKLKPDLIKEEKNKIVVLSRGGRQFCCSKCQNRMNTSFNASLNMHRLLTIPALPKQLKAENISDSLRNTREPVRQILIELYNKKP